MGPTYYDSVCTYNGGYSITVTAKLSDGNDLPAFITFDDNN